MENHSLPPTITQEEEIDLIALAKKLWLGRTTILKTVVVFALLTEVASAIKGVTSCKILGAFRQQGLPTAILHPMRLPA